jgi:hypothetical protein
VESSPIKCADPSSKQLLLPLQVKRSTYIYLQNKSSVKNCYYETLTDLQWHGGWCWTGGRGLSLCGGTVGAVGSVLGSLSVRPIEVKQGSNYLQGNKLIIKIVTLCTEVIRLIAQHINKQFHHPLQIYRPLCPTHYHSALIWCMRK